MQRANLLINPLNLEERGISNIYYQDGRSVFLLFLKEFANIQASGNPVRMIQTITILVIAIAKLDWILAIEL